MTVQQWAIRPGNKSLPIGFNAAYGLWQIVILERHDLEFSCPTKELAFAAWKDEFDPETGFPRSFENEPPDA